MLSQIAADQRASLGARHVIHRTFASSRRLL